MVKSFHVKSYGINMIDQQERLWLPMKYLELQNLQ